MSRVSRGAEPGGTVEIHLTPARTVEAWRPDGSRISLPAVTEVRGEAVRVNGDSVTVEIERWEGGNPLSERPKADGATATFSASDPQLSFFENRISVIKNLLLVGVIVGLVALGIGQADVGY